MDLNLKGKTAIVCGSTQGIGKASAIELAKLGAGVVLIARDEEKLKEVIKSLPSGRALSDGSCEQKHFYISVDFSTPLTLKDKVMDFLKKQGDVQILINNTGGPPSGQAIDAAPDSYLQAFSNHLICNHILVQATVDGMKRSGYGRIINIISTSVKAPLRGLGVSNTVRGAVANWAKTLSLELGPYGITVNNVLPGATGTQRLQSIIAQKATQSGSTEKEVADHLMSEIPLRRFAAPEEVANAVAFLASPAAGYISGINLPVDGGRTGCL